LLRGVAIPGQVRAEQALFDVAVAVPIGPVAEIAVAEFIAEEGDDPVLGGAFGLPDVHANLIFPVNRLCIMPCLIQRVFLSLFSRSLSEK